MSDWMGTLEFVCTEDRDSGLLVKPCDESSDLYICVNNEYVYISKTNAIDLAYAILKHYEN